MQTLTIALLGAECTGKSTLAQALADRLRQQTDLAQRVTAVPEALRTWCQNAGRAPNAHEQAAMAQAQTHAIAAAQQVAGTRVVLADTTALTVAVYSEYYFKDTSLYAGALEQQRQYHLTLLLGLDLPWQPDGFQRDNPGVREAVDALLRQRLIESGLPFQVLYGRGDLRVDNALHALACLPGLEALAMSDQRPPEYRPWTCDACSDPDCEHRLFSQLVGPNTLQT